MFALAEAIRISPIRPLTCVTSNLPAADVLAEVEGLAVYLLGGQVLRYSPFSWAMRPAAVPLIGNSIWPYSARKA